MEDYLVNLPTDPPNTFRIKHPKKSYFENILFTSKKPLPQASVKDLSCDYVGALDSGLFKDIVGADYKECVEKQKSRVQSHSRINTQSILKSNSLTTWDVDIEGVGTVACLKIGQLLQVVKVQREVWSYCLMGCNAQEKNTPALVDVNCLRLVHNIHFHRQKHGTTTKHFVALCRLVTKCLLELLSKLGNLERNVSEQQGNADNKPSLGFVNQMATSNSLPESDSQLNAKQALFIFSPANPKENDFLFGLLCSSMWEGVLEGLCHENPSLNHIEPINGICFLHSATEMESLFLSGFEVSLQRHGHYASVSELVALLREYFVAGPKRHSRVPMGQSTGKDGLKQT